jgi:ABC-type amino acid transport substrate-binding protein
MSVGALAPAGAQEKLPPLRTGVDGTFAPHAFPRLGGGIQGFNVDLFTEVAKRMRREITIDSVSFSTLIPTRPALADIRRTAHAAACTRRGAAAAG